MAGGPLVVISQEQRAKKRELTREEKADIMRRELDRQILVENKFWFGSSPVRAPLATAEEMRRAVIKVDGKDFRLGKIPQDNYDGLVAAARRAGFNPTPELIAQKWSELDAKRRQLGKPQRLDNTWINPSVDEKIMQTVGDGIDMLLLRAPPSRVLDALGPPKERPVLPPMEGRHHKGE